MLLGMEVAPAGRPKALSRLSLAPPLPTAASNPAAAAAAAAVLVEPQPWAGATHRGLQMSTWGGMQGREQEVSQARPVLWDQGPKDAGMEPSKTLCASQHAHASRDQQMGPPASANHPAATHRLQDLLRPGRPQQGFLRYSSTAVQWHGSLSMWANSASRRLRVAGCRVSQHALAPVIPAPSLHLAHLGLCRKQHG